MVDNPPNLLIDSILGKPLADAKAIAGKFGDNAFASVIRDLAAKAIDKKNDTEALGILYAYGLALDKYKHPTNGVGGFADSYDAARMGRAAEEIATAIKEAVESGSSNKFALAQATYDAAKEEVTKNITGFAMGSDAKRAAAFDYAIHLAMDRLRVLNPNLKWKKYAKDLPPELGDELGQVLHHTRLEQYAGINPEGKIISIEDMLRGSRLSAVVSEEEKKKKQPSNKGIGITAAVAGIAGATALMGGGEEKKTAFRKVIGTALCIAAVGLAVAAARGHGNTWSEKIKTGWSFGGPSAGHTR